MSHVCFTLKWSVSVMKIIARRPVWSVTAPSEGFFVACEGSRIAIFNSNVHEVAVFDGAQGWSYCRLERDRQPRAVMLCGPRMVSFGSAGCVAHDLTTGAVVLNREICANSATRLGPHHAVTETKGSAHSLVQLDVLSEVDGDRFSCDSYHYCALDRRYVGVNWTEADRVDIILFDLRKSVGIPKLVGTGKIISVPIPRPGLEEYVMFHDRHLHVEGAGGVTRSMRVRPHSWTMLGSVFAWLDSRFGTTQRPDAHGWTPVHGLACSVEFDAQDSAVHISSLEHSDIETLRVSSNEGLPHLVNSSHELRPMSPRLFIA